MAGKSASEVREEILRQRELRFLQLREERHRRERAERERRSGRQRPAVPRPALTRPLVEKEPARVSYSRRMMKILGGLCHCYWKSGDNEDKHVEMEAVRKPKKTVRFAESPNSMLSPPVSPALRANAPLTPSKRIGVGRNQFTSQSSTAPPEPLPQRRRTSHNTGSSSLRISPAGSSHQSTPRDSNATDAQTSRQLSFLDELSQLSSSLAARQTLEGDEKVVEGPQDKMEVQEEGWQRRSKCEPLKNPSTPSLRPIEDDMAMISPLALHAGIDCQDEHIEMFEEPWTWQGDAVDEHSALGRDYAHALGPNWVSSALLMREIYGSGDRGARKYLPTIEQRLGWDELEYTVL